MRFKVVKNRPAKGDALVNGLAPSFVCYASAQPEAFTMRRGEKLAHGELKTIVTCENLKIKYLSHASRAFAHRFRIHWRTKLFQFYFVFLSR
jgi:hypothetical protein